MLRSMLNSRVSFLMLRRSVNTAFSIKWAVPKAKAPAGSIHMAVSTSLYPLEPKQVLFCPEKVRLKLLPLCTENKKHMANVRSLEKSSRSVICTCNIVWPGARSAACCVQHVRAPRGRGWGAGRLPGQQPHLPVSFGTIQRVQRE